MTDLTGWRSHLEKVSKAYGDAAKTTGFRHHLELWNEPYLNWASRPGVNYDPKYHKKYGIKQGDAVTISGDDKPTEHLVWKQGHYLMNRKTGGPTDVMGYVPRISCVIPSRVH